MLKFTRDIEISINLLNQIGDKPIRIKDLAEKCGTTQSMLNIITCKLQKAGLIDSIRGRGGGIVHKKEGIKLYDVISVFDKEPDLSDASAGSEVNRYLMEFYRNLPVKISEINQIYSQMQEQSEPLEKNEEFNSPEDDATLAAFCEWAEDNSPKEVDLDEFEKKILAESNAVDNFEAHCKGENDCSASEIKKLWDKGLKEMKDSIEEKNIEEDDVDGMEGW